MFQCPAPRWLALFRWGHALLYSSEATPYSDTWSSRSRRPMRPSGPQPEACAFLLGAVHRAESICGAPGSYAPRALVRSCFRAALSGVHALQIGLLWSSALQTLLAGDQLRD